VHAQLKVRQQFCEIGGLTTEAAPLSYDCLWGPQFKSANYRKAVLNVQEVRAAWDRPFHGACVV